MEASSHGTWFIECTSLTVHAEENGSVMFKSNILPRIVYQRKDSEQIRWSQKDTKVVLIIQEEKAHRSISIKSNQVYLYCS